LQVTTNCLRSCITNPTMEAVLANACLKPTRGRREPGAHQGSGYSLSLRAQRAAKLSEMNNS
jgi:hypothetical protein